MQSIHSIGTVITVDDEVSFVIAGYRLHEEDGMTGLAYLLVPYPLGYLDERSFCTCSVGVRHEVLFEGYTDPTTQSFLRRLSDLNEKAGQANYEDVMLLMEALNQYLDGLSEKEGNANG